MCIGVVDNAYGFVIVCDKRPNAANLRYTKCRLTPLQNELKPRYATGNVTSVCTFKILQPVHREVILPCSMSECRRQNTKNVAFIIKFKQFARNIPHHMIGIRERMVALVTRHNLTILHS